MLLIDRNCIFAKTSIILIAVLLEISEVVKRVGGKPVDIVASYLAVTEILKILYDGGLIHFTSYMHMSWRCDYKVMSSTLTDVSKGVIIETIAQNYNRSIQAVEKVVYGLGKKRGQ